jgi:hypothetical protein
MSNINQPGAGIFTLIAEVIGDVATMSRNARLRRLARRADRAGDDLAELEQELARERHRAWLAAVERQARENRWAGEYNSVRKRVCLPAPFTPISSATEAQARAALSGKRRNPLDQRKFR